MARTLALDRASDFLNSGRFVNDLTRRVAIPSVSQDPACSAQLDRYLREIAQSVEPLGFTSTFYQNPVEGGGPLLLSHYCEDAALPTLLCYGHGDVVTGLDAHWSAGLTPWQLRVEGERIYGRGSADNKGQHTVLLLALEAVHKQRRGKLGYNVKLLIDMSEEVGSAGLLEFCQANKQLLAADILISSDGPRLSADQPTLYLGTRGVYSFDLVCDLRSSGHHSGNWGGLIANPCVLLSHAIATLVASSGRIEVRDLVPQQIPASVRSALANCRVDAGPGGPVVDEWWGEPELSAAERVFGWNALEVLSLKAGNAGPPVNAIPARAVAHCQIRYTVDVPAENFLPAIQLALHRAGLNCVQAVDASERGAMVPTRLDPAHPAAVWARDSLQRTLGREPSVVPNAGGSLPNECFAIELGLPTVWVPHSYPACRQHAGDEHLLRPLVDEGLRIMAGLFWDLNGYFLTARPAHQTSIASVRYP